MIDSLITSVLNAWPLFLGFGFASAAYLLLADALADLRPRFGEREREAPPSHRFPR
jgi:hypothetical protein